MYIKKLSFLILILSFTVETCNWLQLKSAFYRTINVLILVKIPSMI